MRNLTILGQPSPERADAERNREKVLSAAAELHAAHGVTGLKMDEVARVAGVGKGTVYRRFENKAGLASALLDARVRDMHQGLLQGPPPLGPGAPPEDRLIAFVEAYVRHMITNIDLVLLAESATPGGRLGRQVYPFWRHHVEILVTEIGTPRPRFCAEAIMAVLAAEQLNAWYTNQGWGPETLIEAVQEIVVRLVASDTGGDRP
ncbi:TetR/AcrR family transcriptional regulator [Brevibacterium moorei]|uniref:TetR/AcrR family transcriptional regulator n=1 Tax=Brevibacterium moorei TaxID=2968457 RepID=UPI00211C1F1C|nr:TetR/AcrR family transcriptional regulator [Brevibacterium sp. 68QC2CO]